MDADSLMSLLPDLDGFLGRLDGCMSRREQRSSLRAYVRGQLSDLPRKSIEPMALAADLPPRNLQQFLSLHGWDEKMVRDRVQQIVAAEHHDPRAVGVLDETYHVKKGDKTPGVQRQWCGTRGTTDNCTVTVHLAYAAGEFRCLLDSELFLPEKTWSDDRARCRAAGIPDTVVYRPKWEIALELVDRARGNGVRWAWLTFDAGYGMHSDFMTALDERGVDYVGEVPAHLTGWAKAPPVMHKEHVSRSPIGHPRKFPRVKILPGDMHKAKRVDNLARQSPSFRDRPWVKFHVKDDQGGPVVWEARDAAFFLRDPDGVPTAPHRLIAARNLLTKEVKHFVSNARPDVPLIDLLRAAFTRWTVERCFEDAKGELGLSHFEVRTYRSLMRHMILTAVSFLFLSRALTKHRGKKSAPDGLPAPRRHRTAHPRRLARRAPEPAIG